MSNGAFTINCSTWVYRGASQTLTTVIALRNDVVASCSKTR